MSNERIDQATRPLVTHMFRRQVMSFAIAVVISAVVAGNALPAMAEDISCNCVLWVRGQTGLAGGPANAAGYTESVMGSKGFKRVSPQAGAIMVWDANQKSAGSAGHMAITSSAYYNYRTSKWIITVRHADWVSCGIRTTTFSTWGDLYGINFYVRR